MLQKHFCCVWRIIHMQSFNFRIRYCEISRHSLSCMKKHFKDFTEFLVSWIYSEVPRNICCSWARALEKYMVLWKTFLPYQHKNYCFVFLMSALNDKNYVWSMICRSIGMTVSWPHNVFMQGKQKFDKTKYLIYKLTNLSCQLEVSLTVLILACVTLMSARLHYHTRSDCSRFAQSLPGERYCS